MPLLRHRVFVIAILWIMNARSLQRFLKYSTIGFITFLCDLAVLFLLTDIAKWNYLHATGCAFILAISLNFFLSRKLVFKHSARGITSGYLSFASIAGIGLLFVVFGMYVLVGIFHSNYLVARVLVACLVGFWNYLMNLHVNFKVAGLHEQPSI